MLTSQAKRQVQVEIARRDFFAYCQLRVPKFYKSDRWFLKELCNQLQHFFYDSDKKFMVINCPPRHGKSLTSQLFVEWLFGREGTEMSIMTGSYNERLAEKFAKGVRNAIRGHELFHEVFPDINISPGDASAAMWSLEGSPTTSYLATSPGGMSTGIGARMLIIDDVVKNAEEANNDNVNDGHEEWFNNTLMQRLEGDGDNSENWKVLIVMTNWSTQDLAQRVIAARDCISIKYPAYTVDKDGKKQFLCPQIMNERSFTEKTRGMNPDIIEANYQQQPIDIKGRLYTSFETYKPTEVSPTSSEIVKCVTDTADRGTDFLCSIAYFVRDGLVYVRDIVHSDSPMEVTEHLCVDMHRRAGVRMSIVEGNNGGRGFMRNMRTLMHPTPCYFKDKFTSSNKEARIISSSGWIKANLRMPEGYERMFPTFCKDAFSYNARGKNAHDDAVDCLSLLFYEEAGQVEVGLDSYEYEKPFQLHFNNESGLSDSDFTYW
jgi:predicted phage terminase large subunit-like protein